ncbi:MAG: DUF4186 domain-containing protein [Lachnospiraceae bacterium]|nr:DUF4186 domain-containing protein [Lachnospiraceae bacterium]
MAKGSNQKLKIMYLMKILLEQTDETHSISMPEIISALEQYGITAERKSIYNDMESLRQFGMDIIGEQRDRTYYYHVGKRQFELAEFFIAQHATGCCCRGCLEKWHRIPKGIELTGKQQEYVVNVLMAWIERQMQANEGSQNQI